MLKARSRAFYWKSFRPARAAKFFYRTDGAFRARQTHERAEIDERGVVNTRAGSRQQCAGVAPKRILAGCSVDRQPQIEKTRENAGGICFDDRNRLLECERRDRMRNVRADAGQLSHAVDIRRNTTTMSILHELGRGVKI